MTQSYETYIVEHCMLNLVFLVVQNKIVGFEYWVILLFSKWTFNLFSCFMISKDAAIWSGCFRQEKRLQSVTSAAGWLQARTNYRPLVAVICGSGLGSFADCVKNAEAFEYSSIPHFATCTGESLVCCSCSACLRLLSSGYFVLQIDFI